MRATRSVTDLSGRDELFEECADGRRSARCDQDRKFTPRLSRLVVAPPAPVNAGIAINSRDFLTIQDREAF